MNPAIASTFQANGVAVSLAGGAEPVRQPIHGVLFTAVFAGGRLVDHSQNRRRAGALRVEIEEEDAGLDLTQHGERAYTE